jgi:hypothetical protein
MIYREHVRVGKKIHIGWFFLNRLVYVGKEAQF